MTDDRQHCIFSAILLTQVVLHQDEEIASSILHRDFRLITEICQDFAGQVLKSTDDGLLMYFVSTVQAVACAVEMQTALANLSSRDILQHRMGIDFGEVCLSDEAKGNGVFVASQLQKMSPPGGICISQTVYDAVKHSLALQANYLGSLKAFDELVSVYQVLLPPKPTFDPPDVSIYLTREQYRQRQLLIYKVRTFWLEGVLKTSLHSRALISVGLEKQPHLLNLPLRMWHDNNELENIQTTTKITDNFKQLDPGKAVLILGEPGAGKTTILLELAQELLMRAEHDYTQPMPVILNLSAWNGESQSIAEWVVQELYTNYQVAKEIGKNWLEEQQLLLMLDGFDEVMSCHQDACIEAMHQFSQTYEKTALVITSIQPDYEKLDRRLNLQGAVCLQPLTLVQVEQYLEAAGSELAGLRKALSEDKILQELALSPLMLSLMTLVYRDKSLADIPQFDTLEDCRQKLLNAYLERIFKGRGSERYLKAKSLGWLTWLAQNMKTQSSSVFLIERLQVSGLKTSGQKILYVLVVGLIAGLICGLVGWLNVGIIGGWELGKSVAVIVFLAAWIIAGIILGLLYPQIKLVEPIKWSWKKAQNSLKQGLIIGLVFGLVLGGIGVIFPAQAIAGVNNIKAAARAGLRIATGTAIIFVVLRGITGATIEPVAVPNQGIWHSAKNAAIFILLGAIGLELVAQIIGLRALVGVGVVTGLLFGTLGAGEACIKHLALRLVLWNDGCIPWNYARFLDWAAERSLLQKVGGGYIFIHRLFLEYLAGMANR
jgi:adenylate kinase family enzyme